MGWTGIYISNNATTKEIKEVLEREINDDNNEVLYTSMKLGTCYMATRYKPDNFVYAIVILWSFKKSTGELVFKIMDESAGPNKRNPPLKLLNMLSDLEPIKENIYAIEWRRDAYRNFKRIPKEKIEHFKKIGYEI
jgi:hypothetical protein